MRWLAAIRDMYPELFLNGKGNFRIYEPHPCEYLPGLAASTPPTELCRLLEQIPVNGSVQQAAMLPQHGNENAKLSAVSSSTVLQKEQTATIGTQTNTVISSSKRVLPLSQSRKPNQLRLKSSTLMRSLETPEATRSTSATTMMPQIPPNLPKAMPLLNLQA